MCGWLPICLQEPGFLTPDATRLATTPAMPAAPATRGSARKASGKRATKPPSSCNRRRTDPCILIEHGCCTADQTQWLRTSTDFPSTKPAYLLLRGDGPSGGTAVTLCPHIVTQRQHIRWQRRVHAVHCAPAAACGLQARHGGSLCYSWAGTCATIEKGRTELDRR